LTTETVVERTWSSPLAITALQAQQLAALGAKLASSKQYWGSKGEESPGSLIDARQAPDGRWQLYIKDAVGVIGVSDLTVTVQPKIPPAHFLHLLRKSALFPRVGTSRPPLRCCERTCCATIGRSEMTSRFFAGTSCRSIQPSTTIKAEP
jgi:hypothetical protein